MHKLFWTLALVGAVACGSTSLEPVTESPTDAVFATISNGDDVDLADHLVDDDWTLFEYGADW